MPTKKTRKPTKKPTKKHTKKPRNKPSRSAKPVNINRQALDALRDLFTKAERNDYLVPLWRLVTALRGPDSGSLSAKAIATTPIRARVLTRSQALELGVSDGDTYGPKKPFNSVPDIDVNDEYYCKESYHFRNHIYFAHNVLHGAL